MLTMALYVDNLERGAYDIPLTVRNWEADKIVLFSGGDATTDILNNQFKDSDKSIVQIDIHISKPTDIPKAFNVCVNYCYDVVKTDSLIFTHADAYLTKGGMQFFKSAYDASKIGTVVYDHVQLYTYMWVALEAVVLSNADDKIYWNETGDGAHLMNAYKERKNFFYNHYDNSFVKNIGYLTIQQYINKMRSHNHIWPDPYKTIVVDAFGVSKEAGLRVAYKKIKEYCPLVPVDVESHKDIFDYYHVWDEYAMCVDIMRKM